MQLQELFQNIAVSCTKTSQALWDQNPSMKNLCYDSRKAKEGVIFFAIPGFSVDGTKFIPAVLDQGALAVVAQSLNSIPAQYHDRCFLAANVREALAVASANYFRHPTKEMMVVGVTGTKGKTSSTFLLESIFAAAGKKTALLGTVECRHPGKRVESKRTTMESYDLQSFLREARDHGAEVALLEISSHALSLERCQACEFDGVLFTNLSEDHLDFYGGMEKYFQAKLLLFTEYATVKNGRKTVGVTNVDDSYGAKIMKLAKMPIKSFGLEMGDYQGQQLKADAQGIHGYVKLPASGAVQVQSTLTGQFNIYNILGALALADQLQVPAEAIERGLRNLPVVSGRLERVPSKLDFQVFVDFAHMGTALENVLQSLRPICKGKLIVVFGAGGDRDPARRTQLGMVAARLGDYSVITSDNPRTEDPMKIIAAVEAAYTAELAKTNTAKNFSVEVDRKKAITMALRMARSGDVICLAGKGHESGQIIGTQTFPFDDREEARKVLEVLELEATKN